MWPASASTATPSGMWPPLAMTRWSEPSGAMVKIRPSLRLRTTRRPVTVSRVVVMGSSVGAGSGGAAMLGGDDAARLEAVDLAGGEAEFGQHLAIVLAQFRRAPGRYLVHVVHADWTADGLIEMAAGAGERHHDVVASELRIVDRLTRRMHGAIGDVLRVERLRPVGHGLRTERRVEDRRHSARVLGHLGGVGEAWIGRQIA